MQMEMRDHQPELQQHGPIRFGSDQDCLLDLRTGGHEFLQLRGREIGKILHVLVPDHDRVSEHAPVFMKKCKDISVFKDEVVSAMGGRLQLAAKETFHERSLADRCPAAWTKVDVAYDV